MLHSTSGFQNHVPFDRATFPGAGLACNSGVSIDLIDALLKKKNSASPWLAARGIKTHKNVSQTNLCHHLGHQTSVFGGSQNMPFDTLGGAEDSILESTNDVKKMSHQSASKRTALWLSHYSIPACLATPLEDDLLSRDSSCNGWPSSIIDHLSVFFARLSLHHALEPKCIAHQGPTAIQLYIYNSKLVPSWCRICTAQFMPVFVACDVGMPVLAP